MKIETVITNKQELNFAIYQGLFRLKQSDFQMLPSMTYFFQKFVLSKQL